MDKLHRLQLAPEVPNIGTNVHRWSRVLLTPSSTVFHWRLLSHLNQRAKTLISFTFSFSLLKYFLKYLFPPIHQKREYKKGQWDTLKGFSLGGAQWTTARKHCNADFPCKSVMAVTEVTRSGWGYMLVRMECFRVTKRGHRKGGEKRAEKSKSVWCTRRNVGGKTAMPMFLKLPVSLSKKWSSSPGSPNWPLEASQQVWEGKDERPININLPLRPLFLAPKYLIVLGQLCCFVGRASVDPFYKTTPVPAQWRPCPVAPHCPRNGRLQRIQDFFFHHRQL